MNATKRLITICTALSSLITLPGNNYVSTRDLEIKTISPFQLSKWHRLEHYMQHIALLPGIRATELVAYTNIFRDTTSKTFMQPYTSSATQYTSPYRFTFNSTPYSHSRPAITEEIWQNVESNFYTYSFITQNPTAYQVYLEINRQLDTICQVAKSGSLHARMQAIEQLMHLRSAYDYLNNEYNQTLLAKAEQKYLSTQIHYASPYSSEIIPVANKAQAQQAKKELLELRRNFKAAQHLQRELHNLISSLYLELFDKKGTLAEKTTKRFEKLIKKYHQQYALENRYLDIFSPPDANKLQLIEQNNFNNTVIKINNYLAEGNLLAAEQEMYAFQQSGATKKKKALVKEYFHKHPYLNEYGIPTICAETNPHWDTYQQKLATHPDQRQAIIKIITQQHAQALKLCHNAHIQNPSLLQLRQAYHMCTYIGDPRFVEFACKAMQSPNLFSKYCDLLTQRATAINLIHQAMEACPESAYILDMHFDDLIHYGTDPQFPLIIQAVAQDPSLIEPLKYNLAFRSEQILNMHDKLGQMYCTPESSQIAYLLIDATNNTQKINILTTLTSDSAHPCIQEAYTAFHDTKLHLPKTEKYDSELFNYARELNIPQSLSTQEFVPDRILYTHIMLTPITSDLQRAQAQQYLDVLKHACSLSEHQGAYRALAHLAGQTYLHPEMQINDIICEQNSALCNTITGYIANGDIATAANNMNIMQQELQALSKIDIPMAPQTLEFIRHNATFTVQETPFVTAPASSSSSPIPTDASKLDYTQLHEHAQTEHQKIIQRTGSLSNYYQSREHALELMTQGNLSIQSVSYTLNPRALKALETSGIDICQFTTCTGTLIQQDTHTKLVNTINTLADARPMTGYGQQIQNGALECAQAGTVLNQAGHIRGAMLHADMCYFIAEKFLHFTDSFNPLMTGTRAILDAATTGLRAASAHDLAQSLDTIRTNIDQFRTGFTVGTIHGITDLKGIYHGLCSTIENIGNFLHYLGELEAFSEAVELGQYEEAQRMLDTHHEKASRIATAANHLMHRVYTFIEHIPNMSPEEWRQAGFQAGDFIGREGAQLGAIKTGLSGLSKISEGISTAVGDFKATAHEIALSAQLSGNPTTTPLTTAIGRAQRIESVATHAGSASASGIPAHQLDLISSIATTESTTLPQLLSEAAASSSSYTATASFLSSLGHSLTQAKPGYLQLPQTNNSVSVDINLKALMHSEVAQHGVVSLATAQKIWEMSKELKTLNAHVAELTALVPEIKIGKIISDDFSLTKLTKIEHNTSTFYEKIRSSSDDIDAIAKNTRINKQIIEKIKNHVFYEEHILHDGIVRFNPDADMAAAWQRLIEGNFVRSDLRFLQHEFAESLLMSGQELSWEGTHYTVNKIYNWEHNL